MGQDEGSITGEGAEQVSRLAVVQVIDAAAQRLAVESDGPHRLRHGARAQPPRMAAEGGLEIVPAERQEQVAQGVHGWSPPEAGAKDRVQALALESDKGDDPLVGECTRQHGENGEQQQVAQAVALPLRATWIAHLGERGKQGSKWHCTAPGSLDKG